MEERAGEGRAEEDGEVEEGEWANVPALTVGTAELDEEGERAGRSERAQAGLMEEGDEAEVDLEPEGETEGTGGGGVRPDRPKAERVLKTLRFEGVVGWGCATGGVVREEKEVDWEEVVGA